MFSVCQDRRSCRRRRLAAERACPAGRRGKRDPAQIPADRRILHPADGAHLPLYAAAGQLFRVLRDRLARSGRRAVLLCRQPRDVRRRQDLYRRRGRGLPLRVLLPCGARILQASQLLPRRHPLQRLADGSHPGPAERSVSRTGRLSRRTHGLYDPQPQIPGAVRLEPHQQRARTQRRVFLAQQS